MDAQIMYVTYCSRKKDLTPGLLEAIKRYQGEHIRKVYCLALKDRVEFRILSGSSQYNLLKSDDLIECYDHLLKSWEVKEKIPNVIRQLKKQNIKELKFFMEEPKNGRLKPYKEVLEKASLKLGIKFDVIKIETEVLV